MLAGKPGLLTFKPILVALGEIRFQPAREIAARSLNGQATSKTTALGKRLYTAQEVDALGYNSQAFIDRFERERMHGNLFFHLCEFCGGAFGVDHVRDYRDTYSEKDNPPWVYCCGRCYAKVLHAPGASSPYALYGKGKKWADMPPGRSPWEGVPRW